MSAVRSPALGGGEVPMILGIEAEARHRCGRIELDFAAVRRAHRGRQPLVRGGFAADQIIDHRGLLRAVQRRCLDFHLAFIQGIQNGLVAHGLERVQGRRARRLGMVVAGGAALLDRSAWPGWGVAMAACAFARAEESAATGGLAALLGLGRLA